MFYREELLHWKPLQHDLSYLSKQQKEIYYRKYIGYFNDALNLRRKNFLLSRQAYVASRANDCIFGRFKIGEVDLPLTFINKRHFEL